MLWERQTCLWHETTRPWSPQPSYSLSEETTDTHPECDRRRTRCRTVREPADQMTAETGPLTQVPTATTATITTTILPHLSPFHPKRGAQVLGYHHLLASTRREIPIFAACTSKTPLLTASGRPSSTWTESVSQTLMRKAFPPPQPEALFSLSISFATKMTSSSTQARLPAQATAPG